MFLNNDKHKNTAKFFLFYGFFVQKWSKKKERANKKNHYYALLSALYNFFFK